MVNEAQIGAWIYDFGFVEFAAHGLKCGVVDGVGLAVDCHSQFSAGGIGAQVDAGGKESAHEAVSIVMGAEGFTGELDQRGFGTVGDELDGVDEVFSAAAQLGDSLLGRKVFEFDLFWGGFAPGYELAGEVEGVRIYRMRE